jgi:hypothetical protein
MKGQPGVFVRGGLAIIAGVIAPVIASNPTAFCRNGKRQWLRVRLVFLPAISATTAPVLPL